MSNNMRPPDTSLDAERAVLGSILLDPSRFSDAGDLAAEDFSSGLHRVVFGAMADILERGEPVDPITITETIVDRQQWGNFAAAGGVAPFLVNLMAASPVAVNVAYYASQVQKQAARRRVDRALHGISKFAEGHSEPGEIVAYAEATLGELVANQVGGRKFRSVQDVPSLDGVPDVPVTWLVDGFIAERSLTIVTGRPGDLKSWTAEAVAISVASGMEFCSRRVQQRDVLVLDRENGAAVVNYRRRHLGAAAVPRLHFWGNWLPEAPADLTDKRVVEFASRGGLVVVDSVIRFHSADENSATEMAVVSAWMRALVAAGGTVLALLHRGKGPEAYHGSSEILAGVDVLWEATKREDNRTVDLVARKCRYAEETCFAIQLQHGGFVAVSTEAQAAALTAAEIIGQIISASPGLPKGKVEEIAQGKGLGRTQARDAIARGPWLVKVDPRTRAQYYYPPQKGTLQ